jgi:hypothetical protein
MTPAWFKPRRYGYGATPITWQGWVLTFGFIVAVYVVGWFFLVRPNKDMSALDFVFFFAAEAILVAALWVISRATTVGQWRWRWGEDN